MRQRTEPNKLDLLLLILLECYFLEVTQEGMNNTTWGWQTSTHGDTRWDDVGRWDAGSPEKKRISGGLVPVTGPSYMPT